MPGRKTFNRQTEDIGNIVSLEHVNLRVPDQTLAAWFYISGLGLTKDPFVDFGSFNSWINAGRQQFHLPTGEPQVLRGEVHLVVPDLDQLEQRFSRVQSRLKETKFSFKRSGSEVIATCPWGNRLRIKGESEKNALGITTVKLKAETSTLPGIERFYSRIFCCPTRQTKTALEVTVGINQKLVFAGSKQIPEYDGHHIAIYCADFSGPYEKIKAKNLTMEESDHHQYRFEHIFDPATGKKLFQLEHEVRSMYHPMFNRTLLNRNPAQTFGNYTSGRDQYYPSGS